MPFSTPHLQHVVVVAKKSYVGKIFRPVYYVRSPAGRCRNKLEVLARPRPIKLRVNLAPQMIEGGASPVEKNFRGSCFCLFFMFAHLKEKMELLHQADYYFSHPIARRQERKAAKVAEKISCRPSYPTRCIFSYSDYKKNAQATIFRPTFFCPLLKRATRSRSMCIS